MSLNWIRGVQCAATALVLLASDVAIAKERFILASRRRDPRIYAIDFDAALKAQNNNTPNAIVSRSLVSPRRLDVRCWAIPQTSCSARIKQRRM
jgi:hypothetical protein